MRRLPLRPSTVVSFYLGLLVAAFVVSVILAASGLSRIAFTTIQCGVFALHWGWTMATARFLSELPATDPAHRADGRLYRLTTQILSPILWIWFVGCWIYVVADEVGAPVPGPDVMRLVGIAAGPVFLLGIGLTIRAMRSAERATDGVVTSVRKAFLQFFFLYLGAPYIYRRLLALEAAAVERPQP